METISARNNEILRNEITVDSTALGHAFLTPFDAERCVEQLVKISLDGIGNNFWLEQHEIIEKLNLQAHYCAQNNLDNFVVEAIHTWGKMEVLLHNLLCIEVWKDFVLPCSIICEDAVEKCPTRMYFVMYHEATICNLLEIVMFHQHVVESCGDEMLELVDYCVRKMTWLNSMNAEERNRLHENIHVSYVNGNTPTVNVPTRAEEFKHQKLELDFKCGVVAVGILRFLAEHVALLPLSVANRMYNTHDVILGLIPLVDAPPWTYRAQDGKWKKFNDQKWKVVLVENLLEITKTEAQVWIALYNLIFSDIGRDRYTFNSFRKGQLLSIRKYLNDVMIDQLPFLADLQRFMDELSIMETPSAASLGNNSLIMEAIPMMRESLVKNKNWEQYAKQQVDAIFSTLTENDRRNDMQRLADVYNQDGIDALLGNQETLVEISKKPKAIQLNCTLDNKSNELYHFEVDLGTMKAQNTPHGAYNRYVLRTLNDSASAVGKIDQVRTAITFDDDSKTDLMDIKMEPLPEREDGATSTEALPSKLWRQIGTLEMGKGIVQLQFIRIGHQPESEASDYNFGAAYLSVPCHEIVS